MYENPANSGHLIGRIGWDIKLEKVGTLDKTTIRLGVSRSYKDKNTQKYETDWINIVALGEAAVTVKNLLAKGDLIAASYSLRTSKFKTKEGKERESMECQLVGFKKLGNGSNSVSAAPEQATSEQAAPKAPEVSSSADEEIPF